MNDREINELLKKAQKHERAKDKLREIGLEQFYDASKKRIIELRERNRKIIVVE